MQEQLNSFTHTVEELLTDNGFKLKPGAGKYFFYQKNKDSLVITEDRIYIKINSFPNRNVFRNILDGESYTDNTLNESPKASQKEIIRELLMLDLSSLRELNQEEHQLIESFTSLEAYSAVKSLINGFQDEIISIEAKLGELHSVNFEYVKYSKEIQNLENYIDSILSRIFRAISVES